MFCFSGVDRSLPEALYTVTYQTLWQYCHGDPLTGTSNAGDMKKIAIFYHYVALTRK